MNQTKKNISNTELKILYKDVGRKPFLDRTPILIKSKSHCLLHPKQLEIFFS